MSRKIFAAVAAAALAAVTYGGSAATADTRQCVPANDQGVSGCATVRDDGCVYGGYRMPRGAGMFQANCE